MASKTAFLLPALVLAVGRVHGHRRCRSGARGQLLKDSRRQLGKRPRRSAASPAGSQEMPWGLLWLSLSQKPAQKNPNFVDIGKKMLFQHTSTSAKYTLMDCAVSPKVTHYTSNTNVLDLGIAFEEHVSAAYLLWFFLHADSLGIYINYQKYPVANPMKTMKNEYAWILIINTTFYQIIK